MERRQWPSVSNRNFSSMGRTSTTTQRGRRNIRDIKDFEELAFETKIANMIEKERISRLKIREQQWKEELSRPLYEGELILDYDMQNKEPLVWVSSCLVGHMKEHQKEGVRFMWNNCFESLEKAKHSPGSGCILAHSMGLGKTLQIVALVYTLLNQNNMKMKKILICCPKNTLHNWEDEFRKWITPCMATIDVYTPWSNDCDGSRLEEVRMWEKTGGVCLINYEVMRKVLERSGERAEKYRKCLCNPGADLLICDEGHVLKNEETKLSRMMNEIATKRRIVLTGTPMQNALREYYCMVQFVKPNLLGTPEEFENMFVNPILNGQYENSREEDVQLMKERSHILHKMLSGCVQRFDSTTLQEYLPEKREYVLSLALTEKQIEMYRYFLAECSSRRNVERSEGGVRLFADYQFLQKIWTHPYTLKLYEENSEWRERKRKRELEWESEEESASFRASAFWWLDSNYSDGLDDARQSSKIQAFLHILNECEQAGEKLVVFSGSLYAIQTIKHFLNLINRTSLEDPSLCNLTSVWEEKKDYLILTGQTSSEERNRYYKRFNSEDESRLRLFVISTKAGGVGVNLTAANRAILFDVSWNPTHDIQSIFRIYRIGQRKPCFVYRFVASGTMEEKIYERQVAKESISFRVVDEKQIERHFTQRQLLELYQFEPNVQRRRRDVDSEDPLLQRLLTELGECVVGVHEHDSLLKHKEEEELEEQEKDLAWSTYSSVDHTADLLPTERAILLHIKPEFFEPHYLKLVLMKKFPTATNAEISLAIKALMPQIQRILEQPNFDELMKKQALYYRLTRRPLREMSRMAEGSANGQEEERQRRETTVDLTEIPARSLETTAGNQSSSEDSVFLYDVSRKRRRVTGRKKPVKVWGVRGRKPFGSPERDSN